jgi:iron complex outermembrane receptor protein
MSIKTLRTLGLFSVLMAHSVLTLAAPEDSPGDPSDAQTKATNDSHPPALERMVVHALPLDRAAMESAQPIDVLAGEALDDRRGMTLGETLASQPGVASSYYGPGAGRPIIRGLGGSRVRLLNDGLALGDASSASDDHAVAIDPLLIEQIEILRGPATLLFGSGASGGVVNLMDYRIPEQLPTAPLEGAFELRGNSVSDETSGALRLDGGQGAWAWHLDGSWRSAKDYRIPHTPDAEEANEDGHDEHDSNRLANSFVDSQSGTVGVSFIGDRGLIGAAVRRYESDYGIPAPHFHEAADDHNDHGDESHEAHGEEESFAVVDLRKTQVDVKARFDQPATGIERFTLRFGHTDYHHEEQEADEGVETQEDGTVFDIKTNQARLEMETTPMGPWVSAIGFQYDDEDFNAIGAEAYVVPNQTRSVAVFTLNEATWNDLTVSIGGRLERTQVRARFDHDLDDDHGHDELDDGFEFGSDRRRFTVASASLGAIWALSERWQATANLALSQRAPSAGELFANGPHLATFSYERGNDALVKESSQGWDVGFHHHSDAFDFKINAFYKTIDRFIYWQEEDRSLESLPLRVAVQADATLYGAEAVAAWQWHDTPWGDFDVAIGHDWVRGKLTDGTNLPRISPQRIHLQTDWHRGPWRASLERKQVLAQNQTAINETPTDGYALWNARLTYAFDASGMSMTAFVEGKNLSNELARVHTSYLKAYAPLPGRAVIAGVRGEF